MPYIVQFESADAEKSLNDLTVLGIKKEASSISSIITAHYNDDCRTAEKLRTYLESHHCFMTEDGIIRTHKVDGWDTLVAKSKTQ